MENKNLQNEKYLVTILNLSNIIRGDMYHVIVPNRNSLGKLVLALPSNKYAIAHVEVLGKTKDFETLMKELKNDTKPPDMNFGQGGDGFN